MTITEDITASRHLLDGVSPRIEAVLDKMHADLGGYPSKASGTEPGDGPAATVCDCGPDDDCPHGVQLTGPERIMDEVLAGRIDEARKQRRRLEHLARTIRTLAHEADQIANQFAPDIPVTQEENPSGAGTPTGCCVSCYRDRGHREVVAKRYAGLRLCRWCGDWRNRHGGLPAVKLLRLRHDGATITPSIAARYLRDDVTTRPAGKRKPTKKDQRAARLAAYDRQAKRLRPTG